MRRILITSGGTVAPIDPVRHIGNISEGTTGARIAEEFLRRGDTVHYLHHRHARRPYRRDLTLDPEKPILAELARVERVYNDYHRNRARLKESAYHTYDDYFEAVRSILTTEPIDVAILTAAVSDYAPQPEQDKISSDSNQITLHLTATTKVIGLVPQWRPGVVLVGFKLLSNAPRDVLIETAHRHGQKHGSALTVGNSVIGGDFTDRLTVLVTPDRQVTDVTVADLPTALADAISRLSSK